MPMNHRPPKALSRRTMRKRGEPDMLFWGRWEYNVSRRLDTAVGLERVLLTTLHGLLSRALAGTATEAEIGRLYIEERMIRR